MNLRTLDRTYFAKIGEVVEGYTIAEYKENFVKKEGRKIDRSMLILKKGGNSIILPKGKVKSKYERTALLVSLLDRSKRVVKVNDQFELKGQAYKVIDIKTDRVLIQDIITGRKTTVIPLSAFDDVKSKDVERDLLEPIEKKRNAEILSRNEQI